MILSGVRIFSDGVKDQSLVCRWHGWRVIANRVLALDIPINNSTNMYGTIRIAQMLMPNVRAVVVICGDIPDTVYARGDDEEEWIACDYPGRCEKHSLLKTGAIRISSLERENASLFSENANLLHLLATALPFVEDHEGSQLYKAGAVAALVKDIKAAIAKAEA